MGGAFDDEQGDAEAADKVTDGLEVMAAFCAIDSADLRRAVKRIVMALASRAKDEADASQPGAFAIPTRGPPPRRAEMDDD